MYNYFECTIDVLNLRTHTVSRHEYIKFRSLSTAIYYARKYAECVDVDSAIVTNSETGEIMFGWSHDTEKEYLSPELDEEYFTSGTNRGGI